MLKKVHGFSLIELLIGIAIFGVLLALAAPSYSAWIRNAKIRTLAESVQNGLQQARSEAVQRNTVVRFQLVDQIDNACVLSTTGPAWIVSLDDVTAQCATAPSDTTAPRVIQTRSGTEGRDGSTTLLATQAVFTFNGLGRLTSAADAINFSNSAPGLACITSGGSVRCLRINVSAGGQIRMCDPALPATDIQAC